MQHQSGTIIATAWLATLAGLAKAEPAVQVEHAVISRQAEADTGTAHVYVRNISSRKISFDSLTLAGGTPSSEPDAEGSTSPYLWWRCLPNPIPPGGFGDLMVKLARPPERKLDLTFSGQDGSQVQSTLNRINDALAITFVGFTAGLDEMYVYVENRLEQRLALRAVSVNGVDCTSACRFLPEMLQPLGKSCIVVRPAQAMEPGSFVFVRVDCDPQGTGVVLTRAFHMFPITWLDGSLPNGLEARGADHGPVRRGTVPDEGLAGIENIMRCPAHAHGPRRQAAAAFIARHQSLMASEPSIPGMIYVCRWEKEVNYFVFSELADVVRVMPWAGSLSYVPQPLEHRCQWLTALAVRAAAPRPVHAVVPIRFEDSFQWERSLTPDEVRAMVYLLLSRGAKGLCYGRREFGLTREAEQELARTTREVAAIRDYLACAEPFSLARADRPLIEAASLLAGDRALVLLLINHSFEDFDNARVLQCRAEPLVRVEITVPGELRVETVRDIRDPGRPVAWSQRDRTVTLQADGVGVIRPYLVLFSRETRQAGTPQTAPGELE